MTGKVSKVLDQEKRNRRDFLRNAGTVAVTAPAVAILLSSETKASVVVGYNGAPTTAPPKPIVQAF